MSDQNTRRAHELPLCWERLEAWAREKIQGFLETLLEEEVTTFLGRRKSERQAAVDARRGTATATASPGASA